MIADDYGTLPGLSPVDREFLIVKRWLDSALTGSDTEIRELIADLRAEILRCAWCGETKNVEPYCPRCAGVFPEPEDTDGD